MQTPFFHPSVLKCQCFRKPNEQSETWTRTTAAPGGKCGFPVFQGSTIATGKGVETSWPTLTIKFEPGIVCIQTYTNTIHTYDVGDIIVYPCMYIYIISYILYILLACICICTYTCILYVYIYTIHNTGIIVYISILYRDYHHLGSGDHQTRGSTWARGRFQEWLTRKTSLCTFYEMNGNSFNGLTLDGSYFSFSCTLRDLLASLLIYINLAMFTLEFQE